MSGYRPDRDEGDWGETVLDPREQASAELNMDDPEDSDNEPWSPPDRQPRGAEFADIDHESLNQRLMQEEPEVGMAYGSPDAGLERESRRMVGGDDPDAIPAEQDVLGGQPWSDTPLDLDSPEGSAMRLVGDDSDDWERG